jgi:hypothetical protein
MTIRSDRESFTVFELSNALADGVQLDQLAIVGEQGSQKLLGTDFEGNLLELFPGLSSEPLVQLDSSTKAQAVFAPVHFPRLAVVSLVGGTVVFESREDGKLVELDQSQTRFGLSDSTLYVGDCMRNVTVQATKSWINLVSSAGNAVFRIPNSERVFACCSRPGSNKVLVGLGDGDLRGKGRVLILEVLSDGQIVEKSRRDLMQEIVDVTMVDEQNHYAITSDNSLYHLELTPDVELKIRHHVVPNMALKSVTCNSNTGVLVSTATGALLEFNTTLELVSRRVICGESISLSDPLSVENQQMVVIQSVSRTYLFTNGEIVPLGIHKDVSVSSLAIGERYLFGISQGDVVVASKPRMDFSRVFSFSKIANFDHKIEIVQNDSDSLCLTSRDATYSMSILHPHSTEALYTFPSADLSIHVVVDGRNGMLVWGQAELHLVVERIVLWTVPFPDVVLSMCQHGQDRFAVSTNEGLIHVFSLSAHSVPKLVASVVTEWTAVRLMSASRSRLVVVDTTSGGVSTCLVRESDMTFSSVPNPSFEGFKVSACTMVTDSLVVLGSTTGRIRLVEIPSSVTIDETSGMKGLIPNSHRDLCLTVTEVVGELEMHKGPISSMVTNGRAVYWSSPGGIGVMTPSPPDIVVDNRLVLTEISPDPLTRHRLSGNWMW